MSEPCFAEMLEASFGTPQTTVQTPRGVYYIRASWPLVLRSMRLLDRMHDGLVVVQRDGNKPVRFIKDGSKLHRPAPPLQQPQSPLDVFVEGLSPRA